MKSKFVPVLGVFLFLSFFQINIAHAYLIKVGNKNTCVFECVKDITCSKGFTSQSKNTCYGTSSICNEIAMASCGKGGLLFVHQGPMDLNLDIAEVSDSTGSKVSGDKVEKQLNSILYNLPIGGK